MLLTAEKLTKYYIARKNIFSRAKEKIDALNDVSFNIEESCILGIAGESGCGKTTLAKVLAGIIEPSYGKIKLSKKITNRHSDIQMIFQNPYESLDPRMKISESLKEPVIANRLKGNTMSYVKRSMELTGLDEEILHRLPHQLSGGQRQKIAITRAITTQPKLLICDEPTSSLDLCMQAQILDLLLKLKQDMGLSVVFISHNLKLLKIISDRILIMYSGIIIEEGSSFQIYNSPAHPYTSYLINGAESPAAQDSGHSAEPKGCKYYKACPRKLEKCRNVSPHYSMFSEGHAVKCFNPINKS